jgi:hypothetical protein
MYTLYLIHYAMSNKRLPEAVKPAKPCTFCIIINLNWSQIPSKPFGSISGGFTVSRFPLRKYDFVSALSDPFDITQKAQLKQFYVSEQSALMNSS